MRAVNLLPRETSNKKLGIDRVLVAGVALTVLVAAILAGGFFLEKAQAGTERQRLADVQAALAQAQSQQPTTHSPAPAQLQIPSVLSQQGPWQAALGSALASRVAWDVLLAQLAYVVPARVSLTTVTFGSAGAADAAGTAGGTISLGGSAYSAADIATFLSTLARVPKLSQVTLVSSAANTGTSVMTFQITAQMTLPPPPAAPATDTTTTTGGQG